MHMYSVPGTLEYLSLIWAVDTISKLVLDLKCTNYATD